MRQELDELLCSRYPSIFRNRHAPESETVMCWGFACEDGWFALIDALCAEIDARVKTKGCEPVVASQVKEKFGTLRFRVRGGDDYIQGLIQMAGALSACSCERCGEPGGRVCCPACHDRCPDEHASSVGDMADEDAPGRGPSHGETLDSLPPRRAFRLPEVQTARWHPLARELERVIEAEIRQGEMPPIFVDAVIETETLAFRWRGGDNTGRAAGFFRMVEAYSARVAPAR